MITVWGEGRGFRVVWLLEEMGLPYRLRDAGLIKDAEHDPEFLAINPAGFIPALQDGDRVMVESIAIMEVLLARHGPTPLAPEPSDPLFPGYQQFLHLGEAGLAAFIYIIGNSHRLTPGEPDTVVARYAMQQFESRLGLVSRQLKRTLYMAGSEFTAADISVGYALEMAQRNIGFTLDDPARDYMARLRQRDGYRRALEACHATRNWWESRPVAD